MKKALMMFAMVLGLAAITGCSLPSWLGGSCDAKKAEQKK